jgi:GTP cyclohydrolase I
MGVRQFMRDLQLMIDIQNLKDERNIDIKKVGVKGLKYPITVLDRARGTQPVNATINMYVNLIHRFKGTHMSRFVEVLNEIREQVNIRTFNSILEKIRIKLHAESAHIEIEFPYFIEKTAPRSRAKSLMEYRSRDYRVSLLKGDQPVRRPQPEEHCDRPGQVPKILLD